MDRRDVLVKCREAGRIVSKAVIIAVAITTDGQREVLEMASGAADAHEGVKATAAKVPGATWQRCRVNCLRNALAHPGKGQRQIVLAAITRRVGALRLEQNDEWQLQRRYTSLEPLRPLIDDQPARLSTVVG